MTVTTVQGTATAQLGPSFDYTFAKRAQPNAADFNKRWDDINRRLGIQEAFIPDYRAALALLLEDVLTRVDDYIRPAYDAVRAVSQLGVLFTTTSDTSVTIALGIKQFMVAAAERDNFAPAHYLSISSAADDRLAMTGIFNDYERDTGVLTVLVLTEHGTGATRADWVISACPPPIIPAGIDGGHYDHAQDDNFKSTPYVVENTTDGSFTDGGNY